MNKQTMPPPRPSARPEAQTDARTRRIQRVLWTLDAMPKPILLLTYRCPYTGLRYVREEGMN